MQQAPDAVVAASGDEAAREVRVRRLETAGAAAVVQHAHQVDGSVRAAQERRELRGVVHVDDVQIHRRQEYQLLLGALAVARRDPHPVALRRQRMANALAHKTASAQYRYGRDFHTVILPVTRHSTLDTRYYRQGVSPKEGSPPTCLGAMVPMRCFSGSTGWLKLWA